MTTKNTGGPAFPVMVENGGDTAISGLMGDAVKPGKFVVYGGLTIREYFAAKAIQGMLAHATRYRPRQQDQHLHWHAAISKEAYELADAMLKASEEV